MRPFRVPVLLLILLLSTSVAAAGGGLVLGLQQRDGAIATTSASRIERVPAARAVIGEAWMLRLTAADGRTLFERRVTAPRAHHGAEQRAVAFAVIVPSIAGAEATLSDAGGTLRWHTRLDDALLAQAERTTRRLDAQTRASQAKHATIDTPRDGSALARQVAAARASADQRALEQRNAPPLPQRATTITSTPASKHATDIAPPDRRVLPQHPLHQDTFPAEAKAASAAKIAVTARVTRENGEAPGVSFQAGLLDANGSLLSVVTVPVSGDITLDIPGNGNYTLDLRPPPPLLSRRAAFTYGGAALPNFVLGTGWLFEVTLQDATTATTLTTVPSAVLFPSVGDPINGYVAAGRARFAVPKDASLGYTAYIYGFPGHPGLLEAVPPFTADRALTVALPATPALPVLVRGPEAAPVPRAQVQCEGNGPSATRHYFAIGITDATGTAQLPLPRDLRYICHVGTPATYFTQWFINVAPPQTGPMVFDVQRSSTLRVHLRDEAGAVFTGAFLGQWVDYDLGIAQACDSNPCVLPVPASTPVTVTFDFTDPRHRDLSIGPETFATATERTLTVQRLHRVQGSISNRADLGSEAQVVARHADGSFAASSRTGDTTDYSFDLTAGTYTFHAYAMPNVLLSVGMDELAYQLPAETGPIAVSGDVQEGLELLEAAGTLALKARLPCRPFDGELANIAYRGVLHLAGPDGRHMERIWRMSGTPAALPGTDECDYRFSTNVSPGTYAMAVTLPGWPERALGSVTVTENATQEVEATFARTQRSPLWQPLVRYADGTVGSGVTAILYDETQRGVIQLRADNDGRLTLPTTPGWGAELFLPDAAPGTSVRRTFLFGDTALPETITLDQVTVGTAQDNGLQRLFGNGDQARRYNILFVAEGYTDARETFDDRNGNGTWDGVSWIDVDGDGVYNSSVDWYATYGNAPAPVNGSVPDANNEPFTDLNGDGALSIDDRALFLENAHVFMRSLLGSDYWRDHRDMFNAYTLFSPSPQAGFDLIDEDQTTVLQSRDTLYGAAVELDRFTILLDRDTATQQALNVLPDVDVVIVLVNQPVQAGRANVTYGGSGPGVMVYAGGMQEVSPNGIVQSHEMGHFVGQLCDEYDEFPGQHPQSGLAGPGCANASLRHEREHLPWGDLVSADADLPTLDVDGSTNAFIGSLYYNDGAYRPTLNSTMRYNTPFFNEPSRRALAANTCSRTQGALACTQGVDDELRTATWWDPAESGWGLFTIDQGNILAPGWFTYDDDGEPVWFLVPGALPQADGSYKGEILRYTGVPFPQIAGNAANPPTPVGDATLVFEGRDRLRFTYAMDGGVTRTRALSRFVYGDRDIVCRASTAPLEQATQYSDLWWSPATSGWGLFIAHVGDTLFATWYTYDLDGEAVFMVGSATRQPDGSYSGPLVRQRDGTPYAAIDGAAPSTGADPVGTIELRFDNGNAGSFRYTVGPTTGTHAITRLRFGDTAGACNAEAVSAAAAVP